MIAFHGTAAILLSNDDAEGTNHNAGPACHALVGVVHDFSRFRVPGNAARYTSLRAEGILAVPALEGDRSNPERGFFIADFFHVDPLTGQRMFLNRLCNFFCSGVRNRTGDFAGPAGEALFYDTKNTFQYYFLKSFTRIADGPF